ncbi:carbonic anhydrase 2-like [Centruroides vittatus]|uniref:carbonic anhydrase 2-like n=1 Tax=Centruroides vittatus TaxID=120091 RepID=UPI00350F4C9C
MKNFILFSWILLCLLVYVESTGFEWFPKPPTLPKSWYKKHVEQEWLKYPVDVVSEDADDDEEDTGDEDSDKKDSDEYVANRSSGLYDEEPELWPCLYKKCRGKSQSPINIDTEIITSDSKLGPLMFKNYDIPIHDVLLKNTGYAIYIFIPRSAGAMVSSEWLGSNKYRLYLIRLSYGKTNKNGSGHSIDSKYFPLEVSLYHLNTKYKNLEDKFDSTLALSILHKIDKENKALKVVTESVKKIKKIDSNTTAKSELTLKDLLPSHLDYYITYNGSRLVPPCSEYRKWIIFHYPGSVSKGQLEKFRTVDSKKGNRELNVVRPTQPLNDRKIISSKPIKDEKEDWW